MPTSPPVVVAFGDIQQVVIVAHANAIIEVLLRPGGLISLHADGDDPEILQDLPFGGSKDVVSATVVGDILYLAWGAGGLVYFASWNIPLVQVNEEPVPVFQGSLPSIQYGLNSRFVCHYVSLAGNHESRISLTNGVTWGAPDIIDTKVSTDVEGVGVSVSDLNNSSAEWINTKEP